MKILLANPPRRYAHGDGTETVTIVAGSRWPHQFRRKIGQKPDYSPFPLYMAYAAAMLERVAGVQVFVRDSIALDEGELEFMSSVHQVKPDAFFFEPATITLEEDLRVCRNLRTLYPAIRIVVGGIHASAMPAETVKLAEGAIDSCIVGEYEESLVELVERLRDGLKLAKYVAGRKFAFRPGVWPARHLFPTNGSPDFKCYHDGFITRRPSATLHASRGCITNCDFCTEISLIEKKYVMRDVGDICDEIELLTTQGIQEVYFDDSIFTGSRRHVLDFCREMKHRGLHHRVSWSAMCAFMGGTDEELLMEMARAGCIGVKFGIDSADEKVLKEIGKPLKPERLMALCKVCNDLGIKCHGTLAIGHFADTPETVLKTLQFAGRISCDTMQFSTVTPYPGTPLHEKLKAAGRLRSTDWRDFNGLSASVILWSNGLTAEKLDELVKHGEREWMRTRLLDPLWWWRQWRFFLRVLPGGGWRLVLRRLRQLWQVCPLDLKQGALLVSVSMALFFFLLWAYLSPY
ncbi:MAG: radical SAM protein [Patescibacteria group bacterium]|nr:radical SAM protein [Patescibacteria group bacterium]